MFIYSLEFCESSREARQEVVREWELENLSVDEAPGLIYATLEPNTQNIDENTHSVVGLVVNEQQLSFEHQYLPDKV